MEEQYGVTVADCENPSDVEAALAKPPDDDEIVPAKEESTVPAKESDDTFLGPKKKKKSDDTFQADEHHYRQLVLAAYTGNWKAASTFFKRNPDAKTAKITSKSETALHIATMTGHDHFVEKLVEVMDESSLAMADTPRSRTALHYAAMGERIRMIKALVRKNPSLTQLPDKFGSTPLHLLSKTAPKDRDVLRYLAGATNDNKPGCPFSGPYAASLMCGLAECGFQDVVWHLVRKYPNLLKKKRGDNATVVSLLARDPSNFLSGSGLNCFERFICRCIPLDFSRALPISPHNNRTDKATAQAWLKLKIGFWNATQKLVPRARKIRDAKLKHDCSMALVRHTCEAIDNMMISEVFDYFQVDSPILEAANKGIVELIELCLEYYPELIVSKVRDKTILSSAIEYRQEKVFRLLSKRNALNKKAFLYTEEEMEGNEEQMQYLLPLVANWPVRVSCAAFQMQTEVQWFKAVEDFVDYRETALSLLCYKNMPWVKFKDNHEKMRKNGEQWMKGMSKSCMLVAALIATVVFAAAFTVPGGYVDSTGIPLFLYRGSFMVFAVSTASALFSSVTAILMFLAILTSRYDPIDFLKSLPQKMIFGLFFLFLSLASMMVSFGVTLTLLLDKRVQWIIGPVVLMASIPIVMFVTLQLPLFVEMVKSTYRPKIFHGKRFWE